MINEQQTRMLDEATRAAEAAQTRAGVCGRLGLTVLAREYDSFAKGMLRGVEWQRLALGVRDDDAAKTSEGDKSNGI